MRPCAMNNISTLKGKLSSSVQTNRLTPVDYKRVTNLHKYERSVCSSCSIFNCSLTFLHIPCSLVGQDIRLSPVRPGFESRQGNIFMLNSIYFTEDPVSYHYLHPLPLSTFTHPLFTFILISTNMQSTFTTSVFISHINHTQKDQ